MTMPWETDETDEAVAEAEAIVSTPGPVAPSYIGRPEVVAAIGKYLKVEDWEAVDVIMATALAIYLPGDPLWLHVVAPSGGCKTELLSAITGKKVTAISTLTGHTLVSGLKNGNADASLLPLLDGKLLIIKDFTSILSSKRDDAKIIFAQLREAYDGSFAGGFGSGVGTREYKAHFGIITGVTSALDIYRNIHAALGERFLRVNMRGDSAKAVRGAMEGESREKVMREELAGTVGAFLENAGEWVEQSVLIEQRFLDQLHALAVIIAWLRSPVLRDSSHHLRVDPMPEYGTRLVKQLMKLGKALANWRGRSLVSMEDYLTVRRVALDGIPQARRDIIDVLRAADATSNNARRLSSIEVSDLVGRPQASTKEALEDLWLLKILSREGDDRLRTWALTDETRSFLGRAIIDPTPASVGRVRQGQVVPGDTNSFSWETEETDSN
jgi:hypothetical protein